MASINFSEIAPRYEKNSLIQKSASENLISLINIGKDDDVLDLGCGTGHLSERIREMTNGKVVGIDPSEGMIKAARQRFDGLDITFEVKNAEEMRYRESFDIIFCNSVFQWFKRLVLVLENCYRALRSGGKIGIQAPAKKIYCPNFIQATEKVATDPRTNETFAHFKNPWFFLETEEEYQLLLESLKFKVLFAKLDVVKTLYTPEKVFSIFESGATAGYLNQEFYDVPIGENYIKNLLNIVRKSFFYQRGKDGKVELMFNRIYLLAKKI